MENSSNYPILTASSIVALDLGSVVFSSGYIAVEPKVFLATTSEFCISLRRIYR